MKLYVFLHCIAKRATVAVLLGGKFGRLFMRIEDNLDILADVAKYDVSCAFQRQPAKKRGGPFG